MNYLDNYINNQNLSKEELEHMYMYPLRLCAYNIKNIDNYEKIYGRISVLQKTKRCWSIKDVFHIINSTNLTKWQKFKLKFLYCFL